MAISFGGEFTVQRKKEDVYAFLTDPNAFAPLLPDYQSHTVQDDRNFTVKVNVGISYIRGAAEVKMQLAEADRPTRAAYKGQGSVAGGGATMTAGFDLADSSGGTQVKWKGEAQLFGRLTAVAGGLLEPLAKKNVEKLINGLKTALDSQASASAP
jgi:carbon monoxide dehydrogenase subunit G